MIGPILTNHELGMLRLGSIDVMDFGPWRERPTQRAFCPQSVKSFIHSTIPHFPIIRHHGAPQVVAKAKTERLVFYPASSRVVPLSNRSRLPTPARTKNRIGCHLVVSDRHNWAIRRIVRDA